MHSTSCKTEIILDVIDVSFNDSPDFIGVILFLEFDNAKLEDIAKMPIDVQLFDFRISSMGRHGAIGNLIRRIRFIKALSFYICFELIDESVSVLGIIFINECFDAGRIKDGHVSFGRVNCLVDEFSNINKVIEYEL